MSESKKRDLSEAESTSVEEPSDDTVPPLKRLKGRSGLQSDEDSHDNNHDDGIKHANIIQSAIDDDDSTTKKVTRGDFYDSLVPMVRSLIQDEQDLIANLSNISSLIYHEMHRVFGSDSTNWCGFYLMKPSMKKDGPKEELVLGPFQGKVACIRIPVGRGVCGTAVSEQKTQLVKNVDDFPGHIACDSQSQSEIVVPLIHEDGSILGVLDIDCPIQGGFDLNDQSRLEEIAQLIVKHSNWIRMI